jgi:flavodoxin
MKILVTCFSQTGNTRQIAEAINRELDQSNSVDLITIDQIDADRLNTYDLLFIGSPIHARGLSAPVKEFLDALPDHPSYKVAAFITHASSAYSKDGFESAIQQIADICGKKSIAYQGCFDCQGRLTPEIRDAVQKAQNIPDNEWVEKMAECDKHPNAEDEENAKAFAREIITHLNL